MHDDNKNLVPVIYKWVFQRFRVKRVDIVLINLKLLQETLDMRGNKYSVIQLDMAHFFSEVKQ